MMFSNSMYAFQGVISLKTCTTFDPGETRYKVEQISVPSFKLWLVEQLATFNRDV